MSVQEIKDQLVALPRDAQNEVMAFLFHLRHVGEAEYQHNMAERLDDKASAHWLSPDDFEAELNKRDGR